MTKIYKNHGFTLVELIVVIAIVAILAAVSITGYSQFIDKARVSNDTTDVTNMNKILSAYYMYEGITDYSELDAPMIRTIINIDNDYTFIPRVDTHSFVFNQTTGKVELSDADDVISLRNGDPYTALLDDPVSFDHIESLSETHLLLDTGGSLLADVFYGIRNLRDIDSFAGFIGQMTAYADLQESLEVFDPDNGVMYVNDFYSVISASTLVITMIIFSDQIESIPAFSFKPGYTYDFEVIQLPSSAKVIETKAFVYLPDAMQVTHDNINNITVEEDAFAETTINNLFRAKEGTAVLYDLEITITRSVNATYKYMRQNVDLTYTYVGKRIDIQIVNEDYQEFEYYAFDEEDKVHEDPETYYECDGSFYLDSNGTTLLDDAELLSVFNKDGYMVQINYSDQVVVNVVSDEGNAPTVAGLSITYFKIQGKQYISVKTYDSEGNLFAKGYREFIRSDGIVIFEEQ